MSTWAITFKIQSDFDRLALFDDDGWSHNSHYSAFLLRHLPAPCAESLEIGCGTGGFARQLAAHSNHVLGIDLSPQMISVAQARSTQFANITFMVDAVMSMQFPATL